MEEFEGRKVVLEGRAAREVPIREQGNPEESRSENGRPICSRLVSRAGWRRIFRNSELPEQKGYLVGQFHIPLGFC